MRVAIIILPRTWRRPRMKAASGESDPWARLTKTSLVHDSFKSGFTGRGSVALTRCRVMDESAAARLQADTSPPPVR